MSPLVMFVVKKLLGVLGLFIVEIVKGFLADKETGGLDVLDQISRVVKQATRQLANTDLSEEERFATALRVAKNEGTRLGVEIGDNLGGLLVKAAWGAVKAGS